MPLPSKAHKGLFSHTKPQKAYNIIHACWLESSRHPATGFTKAIWKPCKKHPDYTCKAKVFLLLNGFRSMNLDKDELQKKVAFEGPLRVNNLFGYRFL